LKTISAKSTGFCDERLNSPPYHAELAGNNENILSKGEHLSFFIGTVESMTNTQLFVPIIGEGLNCSTWPITSNRLEEQHPQEK